MPYEGGLIIGRFSYSLLEHAAYSSFVQVHLQTQQMVSKGVFGMAIQVVKTKGVLALYNGLSASLGRQVNLHIVS